MQSSAKETPLCFKRSGQKPSGYDNKLREKLKDEMQRKQLQQGSTS